MANLAGRRMMAEIDGDFVVFLIGARFNSFQLLKTVLDLGGRRGMKHMLDYLVAHPEKGLLGYQMGLPTIVQYWRSFEQLEAYARSKDSQHWPAWVDFNQRFGKSRGDVGIWHETYQARAGEYETVYSGMPPTGLGKVGKLVPAVGGRESARGRFARRPDAPAHISPGAEQV